MSEMASLNAVELAAHDGNLDIMKFLIEEQDYDPKQKGLDNSTLLHPACLGGSLNIVKYLIDNYQLDPMSITDKGSTPLHFACHSGHLDVVRYLVEEQSVTPDYGVGYNNAVLSPVYEACRMGHLKVMKFLIDEKGCNHNHTFLGGGYELNLLHMASLYGHIDVARYLIEEKSYNPMSKTTYNHSPLSLACKKGGLNIVKYLVNEKSIDPVYELDDGQTPLHLACVCGHLEIVKFLIEEKGCDPMFNNERAATPYGTACANGHLNVVRYLTEDRQCDPLCRGAHRIRAIAQAAICANVDILKYFVEERGCDLKASGAYEETIRTAIMNDNKDAVRYLSSVTTQSEVPQQSVQPEDHHVLTAADLQLDRYDLVFLMEHLQPIASQWKALGLQLGLSYGELNTIEATPLHIPGGPAAYLREVLSRWLDRTPPHPTLSKLCDALRSHTVNQSRIALELQQQYQTHKTAVADQGKEQDASPVPQQEKYLEETHSSQSSSDRQLQPPGEPPLLKRERMKQENEAPPPNVPLSGPPHLLDPDDLAFLVNHLQPMACRWKAFGLQLGLLPGDLDTIAATPLLIPGGPPAYLEAVLTRWLDRAPPLPSLTKLCDALRSRAVDQSRIALELEQQYQTWKTAQKWEDDSDKLKSLVKKAEPTGRQLGAGAYGSVEQVNIEGTLYAAKRFRVEICKSPNESHEKFFAELRILCSIHHPNIVQYHCVCYLPNSKSPALVMEQLQTNLHDYLLNPSYANLPMNAKVSILQDIARGLAYLHNHKPAVIHRDLTARNVLLNSDRVAKISDFGNSRIIDIDPACSSEFISTTHVPGTIIYMPPEASSDHAKFNKKLDIFSFGHLALFTATQVLPYNLLPVYDDDKSCYRSEVERRQKYIDQLEQQLGGDHDLLKLIKQCLHNSPKMRPTADDIIRDVEQRVVATHTCFVQ